MQQLAEKKIGVNEVEREAWIREANRMVKKVYRRPRKKKKPSDKDKEVKRNEMYVGNQITSIFSSIPPVDA